MRVFTRNARPTPNATRNQAPHIQHEGPTPTLHLTTQNLAVSTSESKTERHLQRKQVQLFN
eukprot:scaffold6733_cov77-Cyclotella_meneghiniana.AAC.5